jgi:signal transduction histidine kinase
MRVDPMRPIRYAPIGDRLMGGRETDMSADATSWLIDRQLIGIVLLDQDGIVADRLGGLVAWVNPGRRFSDCMPFLTGHEDALEAVAQGRQQSLFLSGIRNPGDAGDRRRSLSIHCFRTLGGRGTTLLFQDTTATGQRDGSDEPRHSDLALAERRMTQAQESAEVANQARSLFLAHVSHELRTPLNVIIGNAEILRDWDPGTFSVEDLHIFAEDILDNGTFLLDHINDLLDLARAEVGGIALDEEEVEIDLVVDGAVAAVRKLPHAGVLTIEHEAAAALPRLLGDQQRLRQIVLHILLDAVRVTPNGCSVLVRTFVAEDDALTIEISHNGTGIASASLGGVLQPLGMADSRGDGRAHAESALGVPLARTLIELHDGTLTLEGAVGETKRLALRFPPDRTQAII